MTMPAVGPSKPELHTVELERAYEVCDGGTRALPVVITCEHASVRMPRPWSWSPSDLWLVGTHWSYDPGADEITRELAHAFGCPAVLTRFTRMLVDPNRRTDSPTLFRDVAEGRPVQMNTRVDEAERELRLRRLYTPFHRAVDHVLDAEPFALVLSIHTFTPVYEGIRREMELGVIFDEDQGLAVEVAGRLARTIRDVRLNEPYTGRNGGMYSARVHALRQGIRALEIEVRQDIAIDPARRIPVVEEIRNALAAALADN